MGAAGRFLQATRTISILTLFSRVLGLVRECLLGYFFGATGLLSAFRIAWMLPNLSRRLFGEGALSAALIPVLSQTIEKDGEQRGKEFVAALLVFLTGILVFAVLAVELAIVGIRSWHDDLSLRLAATLMPYMLLICLVAIVSGVLQVRRHFAVPAACPVVLNLTFIAAMLVGGLWMGLSGESLLYMVAVAALVAGVLQLALISTALTKVGFVPRLGTGTRAWRSDPNIRKVLTLMAPAVIGLAAMQLNALADYVIAYFFVKVDGERVGPAVLGFAQYLYQLPLGVFGISIATAAFPQMCESAARDDHEGLADTILHSLKLGLFVSAPAAIGLVVIASPLVETLFQQGAFGASDTQRVAGVLVYYALGLPAYFAQHILVRAFYAKHNTRTPARLAMFIVGLNLALNLLLVVAMAEQGLALSTAICAYIQVAILASLLHGDFVKWPWRSSTAWAIKVATASAIMFVAIEGLAAVMNQIFPGALSAIRLTAIVGVGVLSYGLSAKLLSIPELHLIRSVKRQKQTPA